tara:strand:- start:3268 stop:3597 length:330 start_codon:yes stop_codon:yes gene_type:complete
MKTVNESIKQCTSTLETEYLYADYARRVTNYLKHAPPFAQLGWALGIRGLTYEVIALLQHHEGKVNEELALQIVLKRNRHPVPSNYYELLKALQLASEIFEEERNDTLL